MNTQQPFIIMSAELSALSTEENAHRSEALSAWLDAKGWAHKPVIGSYKGSEEIAVVIPVTDSEHEAALYRLAKAYGQESVLYVDANRYATLIYVQTGKLAGLGMFRKVSELDARQREAYTHDIMEGAYYVAG